MANKFKFADGSEMVFGSRKRLLLEINGDHREVTFTGFAHQELLKDFWTRVGTIVSLPIVSYSDGTITTNVPSGKIAAVVTDVDIENSHVKDELLIITRPAANPYEQRVHDRHPVAVGEGFPLVKAYAL